MIGRGLLAELFAGLPVVTREADPSVLGPVAQSWPEERLAVSRAVERRRFEYLAARHLARQAFAELGVRPCAVLNHADRSPCWPTELIGSLSHTSGWCGVALSRRDSGLSSLGIDAERLVAMSVGVLERVLTVAELADHEASGRSPSGAVLRFSAKEAIYKALYPRLKRFIGFHEVEVWPNEAESTFEVRAVSQQLASELRQLPAPQGRYRRDDDICVTSVILGH